MSDDNNAVVAPSSSASRSRLTKFGKRLAEVEIRLANLLISRNTIAPMDWLGDTFHDLVDSGIPPHVLMDIEDLLLGKLQTEINEAVRIRADCLAVYQGALEATKTERLRRKPSRSR